MSSYTCRSLWGRGGDEAEHGTLVPRRRTTWRYVAPEAAVVNLAESHVAGASFQRSAFAHGWNNCKLAQWPATPPYGDRCH